MIALDTNLLIYAFRPDVPEHARARAAIARAREMDRGWGFAAASVAEFWSLATRIYPGRRYAGAAPGEAGAFIAEMTRAGALIWQGEPDLGTRLVELAIRLGITGKRIFDLQIALTVWDGGATEIWTADRKFVELPGLKVVHAISTTGRS